MTKKIKAGGDPVNDVGSRDKTAVKGEAVEDLPGSKSVVRNKRRVRGDWEIPSFPTEWWVGDANVRRHAEERCGSQIV